jgi:hypothetical protein
MLVLWAMYPASSDRPCIQGLPELADQNNTVKSLSSGNNRKNTLKNPSSLDFKIRTLLIDQSLVDIKLP